MSSQPDPALTTILGDLAAAGVGGVDESTGDIRIIGADASGPDASNGDAAEPSRAPTPERTAEEGNGTTGEVSTISDAGVPTTNASPEDEADRPDTIVRGVDDGPHTAGDADAGATFAAASGRIDRVTCHLDGTVSYKMIVEVERTATIPPTHMTSMSEKDRVRVKEHLTPSSTETAQWHGAWLERQRLLRTR